MLAKKKKKNQITLPRDVVKEFKGIDYFDAIVSGDRDLLDLGAFRSIPILSVAALENHFS